MSKLLSLSFPVTFLSDETSVLMIRRAVGAGAYRLVDDSFTDMRNSFRLPQDRTIPVEATCLFEDGMTTPEIVGCLARLGKRPALPEHHFSFGCQQPELQVRRRLAQIASPGTALSPRDAEAARQAAEILEQEKLTIATIGRSIETCVSGHTVFPVFSCNGSFGAGTSLIGYHADNSDERVWDPHCFFLTVAQ